MLLLQQEPNDALTDGSVVRRGEIMQPGKSTKIRVKLEHHSMEACLNSTQAPQIFPKPKISKEKLYLEN